MPGRRVIRRRNSTSGRPVMPADIATPPTDVDLLAAWSARWLAWAALHDSERSVYSPASHLAERYRARRALRGLPTTSKDESRGSAS